MIYECPECENGTISIEFDSDIGGELVFIDADCGCEISEDDKNALIDAADEATRIY